MRKLSLLLLSLFCSCFCFAQEVYEYHRPEFAVSCLGDTFQCSIVIAAKGLKMRDTTNVSGKVIGVIPFGEKVEVISFNEHSNSLFVDSLYGYWWKIKYREKQGYAYSAYLSYAINKMTQPYYLLIPKAGCGYNNYYSITYNYYGFYKAEYGDFTEVVKINPIFYSDDMINSIKADSIIQPLFFIAAKDTIKCGMIEGSYSDANIFSADESFSKGRKTMGLTNGKFQLTISNFNDTTYAERKLLLVENKTGRSQLIGKSNQSLRLLWDGDLDGDGKVDFIILNGKDMEGSFELYLSSKAKKGEFVGRAASFYSGDCC